MQKLEALILKAHKEKVNLSKVQAIKKRGKFLKVGTKFKVCFVLLIAIFACGQFESLFRSDKVKFKHA